MNDEDDPAKNPTNGPEADHVGEDDDDNEDEDDDDTNTVVYHSIYLANMEDNEGRFASLMSAGHSPSGRNEDDDVDDDDVDADDDEVAVEEKVGDSFDHDATAKEHVKKKVPEQIQPMIAPARRRRPLFARKSAGGLSPRRRLQMRAEELRRAQEDNNVENNEDNEDVDHGDEPATPKKKYKKEE